MSDKRKYEVGDRVRFWSGIGKYRRLEVGEITIAFTRRRTEDSYTYKIVSEFMGGHMQWIVPESDIEGMK